MTDNPKQFSYELIRKLQRCSCFYCFKPISAVGFNNKTEKLGFTRDHFFPRSWGNGLLGNTVLACDKCNRKKDNDLPTREEVLRFHSLYSHILGGTSIDLTEFLETERLINWLGKFCSPWVDTRHLI